MEIKNRFNDWDKVYRTRDIKTMGWYMKELDTDLKRELKEKNINSGSFLDLCTGPGTQAIELEKSGFEVTGTDISPTAIKKAEKLTKKIEFLQDDILNSKFKKKFNFIFDRGCFHVFAPSQRKIYVKEIKKKLKPKGFLFLKCFTGKKQTKGPFRVSKNEIKNTFANDFIIEKINESYFPIKEGSPHKALFVVMKNK
jgi:SAM-dependent methyltransferase